MGRPFLTAKWVNLALLTYPVPRQLLEPRLPPGLELDLFEGQACVSLVAFDFEETRVLGVSWPGYSEFPEINLRFYVRNGEERGVIFIRELVPKRLVAWCAKAIYNEPYQTVPMESRVTQTAEELMVEHQVMHRGRTSRLRVSGSKPAFCPGPDSMEHHFKEHRWGFGSGRNSQCLRYEVIHPAWHVYPVKSWQLDWDWTGLYGAEWDFLGDVEPCSVILSAGSDVSVFPRSAVASALARD